MEYKPWISVVFEDPDKDEPISQDDVTNVKILLNTTYSVDEFLKRIEQ